MTKVLVTGSTGFLGTAVVDRLLAHGEREVRCLVRAGSKKDRLAAVLERHPAVPVERFVGSLATREAAAAALDDCELVYHVAAAMSGAPADMFLNTVVTTRNLLDAMRERGGKTGRRPPKLVLVSSFGVYGAANYPRGSVLDETMGLEPHPERRNPYSQAKLRQEQLVHEYAETYAIPTVILRPGVIYGPGGSPFSGRVGLNLAGLFLHLGGDNLLPITYVDNCAEAIVVVGRKAGSEGVYNVVDDDLVTASRWLSLYKERVKRIPSVRIPYPVLLGLSHAVLRYHAYSKGQLPAIFTPYKTRSFWGGNEFSNAKLHAIGWKPIVSTEDGLSRTFADVKARGL